MEPAATRTILLVHNYYQQRGGEDEIFETEAALLEEHGHRVVRYTRHNDDVEEMNALQVGRATLWNNATYRTLRKIVQQEKPYVVHFHNTFPLISPAAYYAVKDAGGAVVQSINNYRLGCPAAFFLRDGRVCEDCLGKAIPWPGVVHACYRDSPLASATVAAMLSGHRWLGTWTNRVDAYALYLTEFAREKFVQIGLPPEKLFVKPNFVHPAPALGPGRGGYMLFVGRLSPEKGIDTLLEAKRRLGEQVPLKIVGDGPLGSQVEEAARALPSVEWLGRQPSERVYALMQEATFLVFPSKWYEGLPRTIVESFAAGTPVVASNLGAMSSLIRHGETGLHFRPGDAAALAEQTAWLYTRPEEQARMRAAARVEFEGTYTAERNYALLMHIYDAAVRQAGSSSPHASATHADPSGVSVSSAA